MTLDTLMHEAELLRRDCNFLTPHERGDQVGLWLDADEDYEEVSGLRRWITLRADALHRVLPILSFLSACLPSPERYLQSNSQLLSYEPYH